MKESSIEPQLIRNYLLGALSNKEEMRLIEEKLLLDDDFAEELSIAEETLIEDYLDGELTAAQCDLFQRNYLIIPERKSNLDLTKNLRQVAFEKTKQDIDQASEKNIRMRSWRGLFNLPAFRFAVISLLVVGIGFGLWKISFYQSDVDKGLAALKAAYKGQRPLESRTTNNFDFAPLTNLRGNESKIVDQKAYSRAEILLLEATQDTKDPAAHDALGILYLTDKKFDEAVSELNLAVTLAPDSAKFHNDLGAAYLEKVKSAGNEGDGSDFFANTNLAIRHLNRALELNENLLEALFNRALILQKMNVPNQARQAWEKYLEKDPGSQWADEARQNLELLKQQSSSQKGKTQILQDFLASYQRRDEDAAWKIISQTKEFVTGVMVAQQLIIEFLKASAENRKEDADKILAAFVFLGELEKKKAQDPYFSELATFYGNSSKPEQNLLLQAHDKVRAAQELLIKPDFKEAIQIFNQASDLFKLAGNRWEPLIVEYQICYSLCQIDQISQSNQQLLKLSKISAQQNYKWIQSLADGWIGGNYLSLGETSRAITYNRKSLETAKQTSDAYNIQRNFIQIAEEYRSIDNLEQSLNNIHNSLTLKTGYYLPPRQNWRNLFFATEVLYSFRLYDIASIYAEEEIALSQSELKDDWMKHAGLIHSGIISGQLQQYSSALKQTEESLSLAETFSDVEMKERLMGESLIALAHLQRQSGGCAKAIENYEQALQIYNKMQFVIGIYEARRGKLLCYMSQNDDSSVQREIPLLMNFFDENRQKITNESDRNTFFDNRQTVYDIATDYTYSQIKDPEKAFTYTESSRARSLLSMVADKTILFTKQPLTLPQLQQNLPSKTQIIYYTVLSDKLLIFHISKTKVTVITQFINQGELENKIADYLKLLVGRPEVSKSKLSAKELYTLLITPVEKALEKDQSICFVPDKSLFQLPFASLVSPNSNKYLIEDYPLLISPSATIFINETKLAELKNKSSDETLLSIGNPTFSRSDYPELADLPAAGSEAQTIAPFYRSSKVFIENQASKDKILNNLKDADVFHFAGHYISNQKSSLFSKLLLAKEDNSEKDLEVGEIMKMNLSRPRLIILAACETGIEKFYNGEGMIGASRAFLASHVPMIIASQWSVDSDATAKLMVEFHRYRKEKNLNTINALRQSQIDMLVDENGRFQQPFYWSGFIPIGGYTEY